jgi:hypothetical protein
MVPGAHSAEQLARRRDAVLRQLKRIRPVVRPLWQPLPTSGEQVVTDGPAIADALRRRWEPTFARRCVDSRSHEHWLAEDAAAENGLRQAVRPLLQNRVLHIV